VAAVAWGGGGYASSRSPIPTPVPVGGGGQADVTITINGMSGGMSFSPNPAAVKAGQTVAWRNADSISQTATGTGFDTEAIPDGRTSTPITFTAAGNLDYPSMVRMLSVTQ
jgi:plastocyanin